MAMAIWLLLLAACAVVTGADVPVGHYTLQILSPTHAFATVFVEVSKSKGVRVFRDDDRNKRGGIQYPVVLEPFAALKYFEAREGFDYFALLKNPYVLMIGATAFLALVMPKMKDFLEAESARAKIEAAAASGNQVDDGR